MRRLLPALAAALLAAALLAALAIASEGATDAAGGGPRAFEVGLWGDLPYTEEQRAVGVPALIEDMNRDNVAFSIFDGDLKNGSSVCSDAVYRDFAGLLDRFEAPAVYLPGDNEWTDCHRRTNNDDPPDPAQNQPYDPLERLATVRRIFAGGERSFGQRTLRLTRQSAAYPENVRWRRGGVVFAGLHVVGSNNNRVDDPDIDESARSYRTREQRVAANEEFRARDAATRAWMREAFAHARETNARAVMLVMQANPIFDSPDTPAVDEREAAGDDGFRALVDELRTETAAFGGPVLLVHGDTHEFRIDKPLDDAQGNRLLNFTRLETFGETDPHWVKVIVDPRDPEVFTFSPEIVPAPSP